MSYGTSWRVRVSFAFFFLSFSFPCAMCRVETYTRPCLQYVHARNVYPSVFAFMPRRYYLFFLPFLETLVPQRLKTRAAVGRSSIVPFFLGVFSTERLARVLGICRASSLVPFYQESQHYRPVAFHCSLSESDFPCEFTTHFSNKAVCILSFLLPSRWHLFIFRLSSQ